MQMKRRFNRFAFGLRIVATTAVFATTNLLTTTGRAETPTVNIWTGDQQSIDSSFDVIETNRLYAASHSIGFQTSVSDYDPEWPVSVTGLTFTCAVPSSLSAMSLDTDSSIPFFAQWSPDYNALLQQFAVPFTSEMRAFNSIVVAAPNAWASPLVRVKRSVSTLRLPPGQEIEQRVVCDIFVPPGALIGQDIFSVQLFYPDFENEGLSVYTTSSTWSSSDFSLDVLQDHPSFVCTSPGSLAGSYSFTNVLHVTSYASEAKNFAPAIQVMYSRFQSPWQLDSSTPSRNLVHSYDNGLLISVSAPTPVLWYNQKMEDETYLNLNAKYVSADNDTPGLIQCALFRSNCLGWDGRTIPNFFISAQGSNLVSATLSTPDNATFDAEIDSGEISFELTGLNTNPFARFTNGVYTLKLYDVTNALRQTIPILLSGAPVTETPRLATPEALCSDEARPFMSWESATDSAINATVLEIENTALQDSIFNLWTINQTDPLPTSYTPEQDLYGCWSYNLMFANASMTEQNGATLLSGYLAQRPGFFNVATQNLSFVHFDTNVPRLFVGDDLALYLTTFGFLTGSNYTYTVDFGDGAFTSGLSGVHAYTQPGTYPARVIVTDNTGAAATGTVSMTVYGLPTLSNVSRANTYTADVTFPTISDALYILQYTDSLASPDWNGAVDFLFGDGNEHTLQDIQPETVPQRFYRLECTLNPGSGNLE